MNKLSLTLVALAATLSLGAGAQQASGKRTGTIDELRACLNTQDDIEARQKGLKERSEKLVKAGEAFNAQAKEINEEAQRVAEDMNATGSGRRARFERKERAFKQEVEAHRVAQETFNADRAKIETDFTAFREKCAETAYLQDDIEKVKKEREAAGKK
ncbi:hypothetical protein [Ramlibacter sp. PS4R-6]|uniref:hypothetical protein n=1 Tax=Ramlibacter sp. PS4R-6 TaxID=3133438 RepID=UPI0030B3C40A